jgi:tRNA nucleotidyltransferase (CCA-adding enzyme)
MDFNIVYPCNFKEDGQVMKHALSREEMHTKFQAVNLKGRQHSQMRGLSHITVEFIYVSSGFSWLRIGT